MCEDMGGYRRVRTWEDKDVCGHGRMRTCEDIGGRGCDRILKDADV